MSDGFRYTLEREKIIEYMKLTPAEKLTWLEEIVDFSEKVYSDEERYIRDRLLGKRE